MPSYRFIRSLSEGAFGRVYLAEHVESARRVAIKELKRLDDISRGRFERELRLLSDQINNQFVVDVLDYNLGVDPPIIVMEYCEGGSLRQWVRDLQPWTTVAAALAHVAQGLAGIHKAGGFHRDIKPDNLLLAVVSPQEATVKVADFGLARVPSNYSSSMTYGGFGTPGYIAPEIMMGADYHSGADIYSLGIVALELLTGTSDTGALEHLSAPDQLKGLVRAMVARVASKRPNIQRVAKILDDLLEPDPGQELPPSARHPLSILRSPAAVKLGLGAAALLLIGGLAYLAANAPEWDERVRRDRA